MDRGWIKIHRSILEWEWIDDVNTFAVFMYLLVKANHRENTWKRIIVPRGTVITSQDSIANKLGLTRQKVRTALRNLQTTNELTIKATNNYSAISICNYDTYQLQKDLKQPLKQPSDNHQTNTPITTNKNDKNVRTKEYSDTIRKIVRQFYSTKIKTNKLVNPKWETNHKFFADSCDVIDKLNRIDGVPFNVIGTVLQRSIKDEFWQKQIISLAGLRNRSKNGQIKFMNAHASLMSGNYRPEAPTKQLLGYRYKCPACENLTVEREHRTPEQYDAYKCEVEGCTKTQLVNKEMVGSTLLFIEKIYKEES